MLFIKTRDVKSPCRAHDTDAGIDFFVPKFDEEFIKELKAKNSDNYFDIWKDEKIILEPGEKILIPQGIKVDVPLGYALVAFEKSGLGTKFGVSLLARVVDHGYQGEMYVGIINHGRRILVIKPDMKIVQFLLLPVLINKPEEVYKLSDLYDGESERGEDGFGSTQTK